mmetsp:Transcript_29387/g.70668  ORF Transcript_29387/g.70668 Transcript_29387/m.70668 type:complete len:175 (+) Transcript_29387:3-527(+)
MARRSHWDTEFLERVVTIHVFLVSFTTFVSLFSEEEAMASGRYMTICLWGYFLFHSSAFHLRQQSSLFWILEIEPFITRRVITARMLLLRFATLLRRHVLWMNFRSGAIQCIFRIREMGTLAFLNVGDIRDSVNGSGEESPESSSFNARAPMAQQMQRVERLDPQVGNNRDKDD